MPPDEKKAECVCVYIVEEDSHPCCAVLRHFLQLGFLGEARVPVWPRQHLEMPITRMGHEVNAQRVGGGGGGEGGTSGAGERRRSEDDGNTLRRCGGLEGWWACR